VPHDPLRKSNLTKLSFRNTRIFFPGHIQRCLASILLLSKIASTHDLMFLQCVKRNAHFTHQNPWLSKPKLTSYALPGSYTPLCMPHGSPNPSPLTKNRALFMSTSTFVISSIYSPFFKNFMLSYRSSKYLFSDLPSAMGSGSCHLQSHIPRVTICIGP
jgi:hypothetical protein